MYTKRENIRQKEILFENVRWSKAPIDYPGR